MTVKVFTKSGTISQSKIGLSKNIITTDKKNDELLKQVYLAELNNSRTVIADTKKRGEVRGGGKKPWKQKGTGRARFGSSRNPIWRGGGVVFGPDTNRNFKQKVNKSAKQTALKQALTIVQQDGRISYIESLNLDAKTKSAQTLLDKIGFSNGLIVVEEISENIFLSFRNISQIEITKADKLSVADVLNSSQLLFTKEAVNVINKRLEDSK